MAEFEVGQEYMVTDGPPLAGLIEQRVVVKVVAIDDACPIVEQEATEVDPGKNVRVPPELQDRIVLAPGFPGQP